MAESSTVGIDVSINQAPKSEPLGKEPVKLHTAFVLSKMRHRMRGEPDQVMSSSVLADEKGEVIKIPKIPEGHILVVGDITKAEYTRWYKPANERDSIIGHRQRVASAEADNIPFVGNQDIYLDVIDRESKSRVLAAARSGEVKLVSASRIKTFMSLGSGRDKPIEVVMENSFIHPGELS